MGLSRPSPFDAFALQRHSAAAGYLAGLASVAGATVVTFLIRPYTTETVFLVPFMAAVFIAAWVGGLRPGLATTGVSLLAATYFFAAPFYSFRATRSELIRLAVFGGAAVFVAALVEARDRLLRRLEDQRQWLLVTLASAGDAVIVTDEQSRVVFINPIAERLVGWTSDEARGRPLHEIFKIVNEFTREAVTNPVAKVMATGAVVGTFRLTCTSNQVPGRFSLRPLYCPLPAQHGVNLPPPEGDRGHASIADRSVRRCLSVRTTLVHRPGGPEARTGGAEIGVPRGGLAG